MGSLVTSGSPNLFFKKFIAKIGNDTGGRSEVEEKVYSWIHTLAQADKDLVFEYVRSTERGDLANGSIMVMLVFISVGVRLRQEYSSSKSAMQLLRLLKSPIKVQRCAGRVVQTELIVQIDQRDIVPGDIIIFRPGDLFPGDVRLLTSKDLIVSQSSLTGESGTIEKAADTTANRTTSLLDLKNICLMYLDVALDWWISTGSDTYMSNDFSTLQNKRPLDAFEKGVRCVSYALIADVGISVDSGVSAAKDLADIILLKKDLNVLVSGSGTWQVNIWKHNEVH
ncbi:hypothetical protein J5N97_002937 [Dioscorea zingiberensis]|uniref:P-type ATPase A domain-containing protein n=1 Tax=Dioscorea zingiberensis TaxID=325984 RepID=A0A9D5D3P8_9LILI|nr:hypothetical protein J5N97_002937 [Dioscorea zingiberensis]